MGLFGKSNGIAFEPTRDGAQPMIGKDGKPVRISDLTKQQRASLGMSTKPAPRGSRTSWGSKADFKKAKGK